MTGVVLAHGSPTSHAAILARARDIPVIVVGGPRRAGPGRGHHRRRRREHRRAARGAVGGPGRGVPAASPRGRRAARPSSSPSPSSRPSHVTARRSPWRPTWARSPTPARRWSPGPTAPGWCGPSSSSSTGRTRPPSRSSTPSTTRSRRRWADGASRCAPSTSVGTSRSPTCRCPSRPTRSSGQRGIRLSLEHRDLLRDQLAAMCLTARRFPIDIMFPMVTDARRADRGAPGAHRGGRAERASGGSARRHHDRGARRPP